LKDFGMGFADLWNFEFNNVSIGELLEVFF